MRYRWVNGTVPLEDFQKFVIVDMACARITAKDYAICVRAFLRDHEFTIENIQDFPMKTENLNTHNNFVKAFKAYARFMG